MPNLTNEPCVVRKHDHLCQIRSVYTPDLPKENASVCSPSTATSVKLTGTLFSSNVSLDTNQIPPADIKSEFDDVLKIMTLFSVLHSKATMEAPVRLKLG